LSSRKREYDMRPHSAVVTGGAGFIGSNLVDRLLLEGVEVDVVDDLSTGSLSNLANARSQGQVRFGFHKLDITDLAFEEFVAKRRPEVIYHLAAQIDVRRSQVDPVFDAMLNVVGSVRVLEAARKAGVAKVIYAASGGTLYGATTLVPTPETEPHRPLSHYGVSKASVLGYLDTYRELYDLEFTALALANVYGPRQDPHGEAGVVSIFAEAMLKGEQCTIFGDGKQSRDFVFVDDVVDGFFRAADQAGGMVINVGTGRAETVEQLFSQLAATCDYTREPSFQPPRAGELLVSSLAIDRAKLYLGWEPWTALAEGLALTVDWLRSTRG
jgi:UDP-glucose 4-epimerase